MEIESLILQGKELLNEKELKKKYGQWCSEVRICIQECGFTKQEQEKISVKMHYMENDYSESDTIKALKQSLADTIQFLEERTFITQKKSATNAERVLIEKILDNFYMYYRAMYRDPTHKKGTLTQELLNTIQIGNEYDLQRMLYAVLRPVFPTIRQEVYSDNGYGGMRADLYLDLCNLIIETKCTRKSMSEKQLAEELGADGFHYRADVIYFFVCDKAGIIKNSEAFKKAFAREKETDGKTIKVFILQSKVVK